MVTPIYEKLDKQYNLQIPINKYVFGTGVYLGVRAK